MEKTMRPNIEEIRELWAKYQRLAAHTHGMAVDRDKCSMCIAEKQASDELTKRTPALLEYVVEVEKELEIWKKDERETFFAEEKLKAAEARIAHLEKQLASTPSSAAGEKESLEYKLAILDTAFHEVCADFLPEEGFQERKAQYLKDAAAEIKMLDVLLPPILEDLIPKIRATAPIGAPEGKAEEFRCEDCEWHACGGKSGGCGCRCHKAGAPSALASPSTEGLKSRSSE